MKVMVTAASRYGATREIAEVVARVLRERGVAADLVQIEHVESLDGYDTVILGSAVYMGRWLEPAKKFVEQHAEALHQRRTWLFSSGPVGSPLRPDREQAVSVDDIVSRIEPVEHKLFPGKIDKSKLTLPQRAVMRAVRAEEGDFRDWEAVHDWAARVADALEPERVRISSFPQVPLSVVPAALPGGRADADQAPE